MILLLDLCYERESLSAYEFVHPIGDALQRLGRVLRSCISRI